MTKEWYVLTKCMIILESNSTNENYILIIEILLNHSNVTLKCSTL